MKARNTRFITATLAALALWGEAAGQQMPPPLPGTYYLLKNPDLPPVPFNPYPGLDLAEIAPGVFIVDDTVIPETPEQAAARMARRAVELLARQADPSVAAARAEERTARLVERRAALAPFFVRPMTEDSGAPRTAAELREAKRLRLAARLAQRIQEMPARKARLEELKAQKRWTDRIPLADGGDAVLVGESEGRPLYYSSHNLNAADTISTDEVWPGGSTGIDLAGAGTVIGMWDGGPVLATHLEFSSRVVQRDTPTLSDISHATGTAGTLIAAGISTLSVDGELVPHAARGMSYMAELHAYDFEHDLLVEMPSAAVTELHLSNHSYSVTTGWGRGPDGWIWFGETTIDPNEDNKFGQYRAGVSDELDAIVYDSESYLPVFSAGNDRREGPPIQPVDHTAYVGGTPTPFTDTVRALDGGETGWDTISPQGSAKNVLTVGAVDDIVGGFVEPESVEPALFEGRAFSSCGPTDDGRIKPDLVANGVEVLTTDAADNFSYRAATGTSASAPSVTGSLNLLRQLYHETWPEAYPMLASTMKALAIHTADDAGNPGPDYSFGWGLMNTAKAAELIDDDTSFDSHPHIKEVLLPNGKHIFFGVTATGEPLRVTICWSDPPGIPPNPDSLDPANSMLRNDLDLELISHIGVHHSPWVLNPAVPTADAAPGNNTRDNVEQVVVESPSHAVYLISITHKGTLVGGAQPVSIVISGNLAIPSPLNKIDSIEAVGPDEFAITWPTVVGGSYRVQSTSDLVHWIPILGEISPLAHESVVLVGGDPHRFYRIVRLR